MSVIDADGHVEESTAMFSRLEEKYYSRRPIALSFDRDTAYGDHNADWLIDGKTYPKVIGKGGVTYRTPTLMDAARQKPVSIGSQEMTDISTRLRDLDNSGIGKQVIYPTLFLGPTTDDVKLEAALYRCYNNFMADACSKSAGRMRFAALVPIRDVDASITELRRAKALGAVSVIILGVAWDRSLGNEELYPFYEEAADLDIPVCVHFGYGCPAITEAFESAESFNSAVLPVIMGFRSVMTSGVLETIPKLRFAFLEIGSMWVPYVIHQLKRGRRVRKDPAEYFKAGRAYVACEADEDINYVASWIGEDAFVMASDFPHGDPSREENMEKAVMARDDVPLSLRQKILYSNPQKLYGV